ncbi:hypothetical protein BD410DRAFT_793695 [Rickenella mellea]|uniref:Sulfhydryl oxidase n=1 Tax=Rickenella mellea TaxID=50990 RepID=A0A4Y7PTW8_9AGAM|nr:hypothetical protein BD410DRAFT_793695 [Rickenella mellea]
MLTRFSKSFLATILFLVLVGSLFILNAPSKSYLDPASGNVFGEGGVEGELMLRGRPVRKPPSGPVAAVAAAQAAAKAGEGGGEEEMKKIEGVEGGVIMSKLGNETAKAALGQATWKLMHTMTLRYPESPTQDERDALKSYFYLQARLYPCGECAAEFQALLKKFPPQTSSRRSAALWLCHLHNQVNERLHKPMFDCAHLDETYDCGCGDAPIGGTTPNQNANSRTEMRSIDGGSEDPMDLEDERNKDDVTGVGMIKGG